MENLGLLFISFILLMGGAPQPKNEMDDSTRTSIREFVFGHYHKYDIDTSGSEPMIGVILETDGNRKQLDSIGMIIYSIDRNRVFGKIPIRLISQVSGLTSVKKLIPNLRLSLDVVPGERKGSLYLSFDSLNQIASDTVEVFLLKYGNYRGEVSFDTIYQYTVPLQNDTSYLIGNIEEGWYDVYLFPGIIKSPPIRRGAEFSFESDSPAIIYKKLIIMNRMTSVMDLRGEKWPALEKGSADSAAVIQEWIPKYLKK
ncbi:hypothetical protein TRIP_C20584 [Candidatus Zixiibacteriota bacterium]|nr:hypothetical protein TRIP_C20584 [candidate division Zixibacteria bacterium]